MAEPVCRSGLRWIAEMPKCATARCVQTAAIVVMVAGLVSAGSAQMLPELTLPQQRSVRPPGMPTPTYPLVKPGLPGPGIGQPPPNPPVGQPAPVIVRLQQSKTHPNGMTILVDSVNFLPSSIVIAIEIFNPGVDRRRLNPLGTLVLTDDRGRSYPFLPPPDNPDMQIQPRSRVVGQLVFLGGVDWQARALRLSINHPFGSSTDRMTATPLFQFSLPAEPRS